MQPEQFGMAADERNAPMEDAHFNPCEQ